ncbi:MAG: heparinase II/III-family protein [Planctomycetota bacterium]
MRHWFELLCRKEPLDARAVARLAAFLRRNAGRGTILPETAILRSAAFINGRAPALRRAVLADAAGALRLKAALFGRTFDLGTITRRHGRPGACGLIPWFHELKTGKGFYPDPVTRAVPAGPNDMGYDKKYMLDLPRLQWCTCLGEAYALTGAKRYARMAMRILDDFIRFVPPRGGLPWANAMDTGIRAANMLVLWQFCRMSAAWDDGFTVRFWQSLVEHVRANLEYAEDFPIEPPHPMAELPHIRTVRKQGRIFRLYANHYLGGRVGVWAVLNALPADPILAPLKTTVAADLERELFHELLPKGMDFEDSTQYHRLVTEFFLTWAMVCRNAGRPIPAAAAVRFRRAFEFARDIIKPDGLIPQIGDMDNGRMHIFGYGDWRDIRYLTQLGACYFNDRALLAPDTTLSRYALWHFGPAAARFTGSARITRPGSVVWHDTGFAVLRAGNAYAAFTALPSGQDGAGGHSHGDKLGVEYSIGPRNIIADPGVGCYLGNFGLRQLFRSVRSHSVLTIDGAEVNPLCPGYPWFVPDTARARFTAVDPAANSVTGAHRGFATLTTRTPFRRTVQLADDGTLTIDDRVPGAGVHALTWRFVLAPGLTARPVRNGAAVAIRDRKRICAVFRYPEDPGLKVTGDTVNYAWEYGRWSPTRVIVITDRVRLPRAARFTIAPAEQ